MLELLQSLKISLLHTGFAQLGTEWNFDNVISPFARLFYVQKGTATVYHSDTVFHLKPGFMYLIPSFVYNRYKCEDYHEQYYISLFEEIHKGLSIFNLKGFDYEVPLQDGDELLFKRLGELYPERTIKYSDPKAYTHKPQELLLMNKKNAKNKTQRYLETQGILILLLSRFIKNSEPENRITPNIGPLKDVLFYISENLHTPLEVSLLAQKYHLSNDHFSRLFLNLYGVRPNRFIQMKWIERAQLLLLTTNDTLEVIAEKVGLNNFSYFSRIFKKITGITPGKYRKNQLKIQI